jgi:hypothetical protein
VGIPVAAWPLMLFAVVFGGDYVHFALAYPFYELQILKSAGTPEKPLSFKWTDGGAASSNSDRWVVYDTSGDTAEQFGRRTVPDYPGVSRDVRHLVGNFYLVTLEQPD